MNISIMYQQLQRYCTMCENYVDEVEEQINKIKQNTDDFSVVWEGEDSKQYVSQLSSFVNELLKLKNQIISYNEYLKGYLNAVSTLDSVYGNKTIDIK